MLPWKADELIRMLFPYFQRIAVGCLGGKEKVGWDPQVSLTPAPAFISHAVLSLALTLGK